MQVAHFETIEDEPTLYGPRTVEHECCEIEWYSSRSVGVLSMIDILPLVVSRWSLAALRVPAADPTDSTNTNLKTKSR